VGSGIQTAALGFGGFITANVANTEEYNGTSWVASTAMTTARRGLAGAGTQTAGLGFGGNSTAITNVTEEYSGAFLATKTITTSTT
jgi:hypothetical protein